MTATYDEVQQWWDNSEWFMSTYPPSAWHDYCEHVGLSIEDLREDPGVYESEVEELYSKGDERTCECEWAAHEKGCTFSPHKGHTGVWGDHGTFRCETPGCKETSSY